MPDDILVVGSSFDPSGLTAGLNVAAASLERFEAIVRKLDKETGRALDVGALGAISSKAFREMTASAAAYEARIQAVVALSAPLIKMQAGLALAAQQASVSSMATEMSRFSSPIEDAVGSVDRLGESTHRLNEHFEVGRVGGRRLEAALTGVAIAGTGVTGVTGRLIEGLVLFGAANLELIELAAAIAVVVTAYNLLTGAAQKAAAENKKLVDAQRQRQSTAGDPGGLQGAIVADMVRRVQLQKEIASWERIVNEDMIAGIPIQTELNKLLSLRNELTAIDLAQIVDTNALTKQRAETARQQAAIANNVITGLGTELGGLQTDPIHAADAARRNTIATTAMTEAQRAAALVLADLILKTELHNKALEDAAKAATKAAEAARKQNELWTWSRNAVEQLEHSLRSGLIASTNALTAEWKKGQQAVEDYAKATAEVGRSLDGIEFVIVAEHAAKLREEISKIVQAVSDLGGIAVDVGILSPEGNQAIQDFTKAGAALAQGDVFGAVVGGLHLVADALGQSAIDRERDAIMKENNLRLTELRLSLDRTNLGGGGLAKTQDVLRSRLIIDNPQILRGGPKGVDEFGAALRAAGLSLRELEILVKQQTGIEILDSRGHLLAKSFEDARAALAALDKQMTSFGTTFADVQQQLELGSRLRGESQTSAAQFQREIDAFAKVGGPGGIGSQFTGLDLNGPAGREALRQMELDLFNKISTNQITGAQLGGLTKEDWLKFLSDGADFLDQFNHGLNNATKSLLNVPTGFNLMAAEFRASAVGRVPYGNDGTSVPRANIDPGRTSSTVISGPVNIIIDGRGKDAAQLADEIQTELKRRSMATVGNPDAASLRRRLG